ncbi:MAG: indole-3-glycerol phosphate synthase TrpC [Thermodesulfobacteriota bacterium]|nr:indole-3-glycerol phosphate synthase TrpC [Thermodesulfobacteriota bacterium]
MADILSRIVATKETEIAAAQSRRSLADLKAIAADRSDYRPFTESLRATHETGTGIIAEIKRASPSKGDIRVDLNPEQYARSYEQGGATAISVLTDSSYFKGSPEDLKAARAVAGLPVLRKDFLISDYQLYESAVMGADAVLLIVRILTHAALSELIGLSRDLNLDALVEIHDEQDLETASAAGAELIGINNRDLKTFKTDIQVAKRLVAAFSPGQIPVAASGIAGPGDIQQTRQAGINNFLIGESLVRAKDTPAFLKTLIQGTET